MTDKTKNTNKPDDETKRDFLGLTAASMAGVGGACVAWPLVNSMNPAKDTMALSTVEVDISTLEPGQSKTQMWQGKPVFIRRRTPEQVEEARAVDMADLVDPEDDKDRVQKDEYLVTVGVCTHLGCIPTGQKMSDYMGDYGGWFCPCHGSHYDTSGRIRKGPAPKNLAVPPYEFISDTRIKIG